MVLQGVTSAFSVKLAGVDVGFSKGSRLAAEFDITEAVAGSHGVGIRLCVTVYEVK